MIVAPRHGFYALRINQSVRWIFVFSFRNAGFRDEFALRFFPNSGLDCMPYLREFDGGIFEVEKGVFSKLFLIEDMNYFTAEESKQVDIFALYAEFLNSFDESVTVTIYIDNRVVSSSEQQNRIFYQINNDHLDHHRIEYNNIMARQLKRGRNDMVQTKYLAVTINAAEVAEAEKRFQKLDIMVENGVKKIGTRAKTVGTKERLEILHDKFRQGREGEFSINLDDVNRQGISSKDFIAPTFIEIKHKHIAIDDKFFCRTVFLNNLPSSLNDDFFRELVDNNFPLTTTINIVPISQSDTLKMVQRQKTGMEKDIIVAQKKASKSGYSAEIAVPYKTRVAYNDADELHDDVTNKSQKMFLVSIMLMFSAPDIDTLDHIRRSALRQSTSQTNPTTVGFVMFRGSLGAAFFV